jgi:quercetin dioxygenase-like cupin family protein
MIDDTPARTDAQGETSPDDVGFTLSLGAQLAAAVMIQPMDESARVALRARLLLRVREDAVGSASTTIRSDDDGWKPFLPKVAIKVLRRDPETVSYLLRLEPGARLPAHPHPMDEECVVLDGAIQIGVLTLGAGDFHLSHRDSRHGVLSTQGGATLFLRGSAQTIGAH